MKKLVAAFCATLMAVSSAEIVAAPALAGPIQPLKVEAAGPDVQKVQDRRLRRKWGGSRRDFRRDRDGYRDRRGYYRGHRGSRRHRRGWRRHNGWWFPPAAFLGGAIIGGAIANQNRGGSAHVRWCYNRYRSYRAYDNTYQPYNGPRRRCVSPYM
ncbi:BA14K family protein [Phyllobacterium phragmitis]|uniref:Lectin-like protein BA14k n=1 Tax=Phyllobacterium phragmitis TaxID=2670329 RepID=A0A2S9ISJ3_9HYPH|nr:BA14K family protein [Phyllobacterium phragmitis]PRD43480.1 BA14K family protein [Phyllobacterium phragmitis]